MRLGISVSKRRKRSGSSESRQEEEPWNAREQGNPAVGFRTEFGKVRNYVDLLRGAAGSLAMMGGLGIEPCLQLAANATPEAGRWLLVERLATLLVGLLIQTIRYEKQQIQFFAPIFFLGGMSVGLCSLSGAMFAFVLIWAVNPMLRSPQSFLSVYSLVMGVFGLVFVEGRIGPIVALGFCFLPVLLSMLAQRPLVLFSRKGTRVRTTQS